MKSQARSQAKTYGYFLAGTALYVISVINYSDPIHALTTIGLFVLLVLVLFFDTDRELKREQREREEEFAAQNIREFYRAQPEGTALDETTCGCGRRNGCQWPACEETKRTDHVAQ